MIALALMTLLLSQTPAPATGTPAPEAAAPAAAAAGAAEIPGSKKGLAANALSAARRAVAESDKDAATKEKAKARLAEAEELFSKGQYEESARAADDAWALVSGESKVTRFRVEVAKDGETEVVAASGSPLRVEAQGVTRALYAGQSLKVKKGEAPPELEVLGVPTPLRPGANWLIRSKRRAGALAPVTLTWTAVPGAESYEVEVQPLAGGEPFALTVARPSASLPALDAGRYVWSVRALRGRERSESSPKRPFELVEEVLKLEVKGSSWK